MKHDRIRVICYMLYALLIEKQRHVERHISFVILFSIYLYRIESYFKPFEDRLFETGFQNKTFLFLPLISHFVSKKIEIKKKKKGREKKFIEVKISYFRR